MTRPRRWVCGQARLEASQLACRLAQRRDARLSLAQLRRHDPVEEGPLVLRSGARQVDQPLDLRKPEPERLGAADEVEAVDGPTSVNAVSRLGARVCTQQAG